MLKIIILNQINLLINIFYINLKKKNLIKKNILVRKNFDLLKLMKEILSLRIIEPMY